MPTNKNALLRYHVLDKCFRNFGRKYYFKDLMEAVNSALIENDPRSSGVQRRQLWNDIHFMKSEAGYSAPIETIRDGKTAFYRYEHRDFSINNSPLNETEAEQLRNALAVLHRFDGAPQFEWLAEMGPMLSNQFGLNNETKKVIAYESNIDYTGHHHIAPLFNAIINERVLKIIYTPFGKEPQEIIFHPHYLKQYNNRWFCFGLNEEKDIPTWNMPLDRMTTIEEMNRNYIAGQIDWEEHFYDVMGVTRHADAPVEEIELVFDAQQTPYILTKPLHATQKNKKLDDGRLHVRLKLVVNYELVTKLLSFGEKVKVLQPQHLSEKIAERFTAGARLYSDN